MNGMDTQGHDGNRWHKASLGAVVLVWAGLADLGCRFDAAGLAGNLACSSDPDCLSGWWCDQSRRVCVRRVETDSGPSRADAGPRRDAGAGRLDLSGGEQDASGADPDQGPNLPDLGPLEPDLGPLEPDLGPLEPDLGPTAPDLGPLEPDLGPTEPDLGPTEPDLGPTEPDLGPPPVVCDEVACAPGEECNRFERCAPPDRECRGDGSCPPDRRCTPEGFCAPRDVECLESRDCPAALPSCNPFGSCVPGGGDPDWCEPCQTDGQCGSSWGVCLSGAYRLEGEPLTTNICSGDCARQACPGGLGCTAVSRAGRVAWVCGWYAKSCRTWAEWGTPCNPYDEVVDCLGQESWCQDLDGRWLSTEYGCSYQCVNDDACPAGAYCGGGYCLRW